MALGGTALVNGALHIPAGAANHRVDAEMTLNRDLLLFSMTPHTHVRGKRWYYEAIYPDGRRRPLLSVPNYDFEWQHEYQFAQPLELPAGTKIHAIGVVRQLEGEQVESRRHQGRLVGRSDLGRDDVHQLHLARPSGGANAAVVVALSGGRDASLRRRRTPYGAVLRASSSRAAASTARAAAATSARRATCPSARTRRRRSRRRRA